MINPYLKTAPFFLKNHIRVLLAGSVLALFSLLFTVQPAYGQADQTFIAAEIRLVESVETFQFRSPQKHKRAMALAKNLRCPQCQNQNLIESNSPVAKDLRLKVYQMVNDGKSDQQVIDFMTSRFGDFVLYQPKFGPKTYVLWLGPILILLAFIWGTVRSIRRHQGQD